MKNLKKMWAVALCGVLMNGSVWAETTLKPTVQECKNNSCESFQVGMYRVKDSLSMKLLLEKQAGERVVVRLLNQSGETLHEEFLGKKMKKYARSFDFSQIKDGRYTLEISNGDERILKEIRLSTTDLIETPARTLVAVN
ncbi:hypothetical protein [Arundinibacter roseus]|uniref:T9SS type A sorting domain-containing protein n=1 Tax=Arundinibacter roseus TaxID=2070510 RepID=A0A4R4KBE0_9BACT|nr:hypothetical protein [Arundinibacter roseus]TDB63976.1 hypothetical protein EZE20_13605 [Arundinibacter roseus]